MASRNSSSTELLSVERLAVRIPRRLSSVSTTYTPSSLWTVSSLLFVALVVKPRDEAFQGPRCHLAFQALQRKEGRQNTTVGVDDQTLGAGRRSTSAIQAHPMAGPVDLLGARLLGLLQPGPDPHLLEGPLATTRLGKVTNGRNCTTDWPTVRLGSYLYVTLTRSGE